MGEKLRKSGIIKIIIVVALSVIMLSGCANYGKYALPYYDQSADENFNPQLFYRNDMPLIAADPTVLYIEDEEDTENYGWFYLYPTSTDLGTFGISAYRSRDLVNWERVGTVYDPEKDSWANSAIWAPDCVYDKQTDKYYLFFSAQYAREDRKHFDSYTEREEYYEVESEVEAYDGATASSELQKERAKYENADEYEGLSKAELDKIKAEIRNYDINVEAVESNSGLSQSKKAELIEKEAKLRLINIRTVKIHFSTANAPKSICVAVSDSPAGPFVQYTNIPGSSGYDAEERELDIKTPFINHEDLYSTAESKGYHNVFVNIDVHPYLDPVSGKKYLYFSNTVGGNSVYGLEMGENWTDKPKWYTLTYLLKPGYKTVDGTQKTDYDDSNINEGAYMYYDAESGNYYLTFSVNTYQNKLYAVAQATGKSPLGPFTKIDRADGGIILSSEMMWDHVSGTGHHSFVKYGDSLYMVYHAHYDRRYGNLEAGRGICVDEVKFIENQSGQKVMIANGPTYSPMPKIGPDAEYSNIAPQAEIKAFNKEKGSDAGALNDGLLSVTTFHDLVSECSFKKGKTEITLNFSDYRAIRAIMIFNSKYLDTAFDKIDRIELDFLKTDSDGAEVNGTAYIEDIAFDFDRYSTDWEDEENVMRPGGSVCVEFDELKVKTVRITVKSDKPVNVSEIFVLGK